MKAQTICSEYLANEIHERTEATNLIVHEKDITGPKDSFPRFEITVEGDEH